jgi:hypothetical protein
LHGWHPRQCVIVCMNGWMSSFIYDRNITPTMDFRSKWAMLDPSELCPIFHWEISFTHLAVITWRIHQANDWLNYLEVMVRFNVRLIWLLGVTWVERYVRLYSENYFLYGCVFWLSV